MPAAASTRGVECVGAWRARLSEGDGGGSTGLSSAYRGGNTGKREMLHTHTHTRRSIDMRKGPAGTVIYIRTFEQVAPREEHGFVREGLRRRPAGERFCYLPDTNV